MLPTIALAAICLAMAPPDDVIDSLVAAHNAARAEHDLPPLKASPELMEAARLHAEDMVEHDKMSHEGTDGSTPAQRVVRQGYHFRTTGENVAMGQESVDEVMESWMNSPHHKANILGDFTEIGAAKAVGDDGRPYWCVDFGRPIPKLDPGQAAKDAVEAINARRKDAGLEPLSASAELAEAAQAEARHLAENGTAPRKENGTSTFERVEREGYPYREIFESTATGQPDPEGLVESLDDPGQAEKGLLGDHHDVGVGYATAEDGTPYWVVLFATKR